MSEKNKSEFSEDKNKSDYTIIPDEYLGDNYDKWFDINTIKDKYNGDILAACEDHPVYFIYYMLGMKPRYYQVYMLDRMLKARFLLGIWGRRLGKSTTFKWFGLWAIKYNKFPQGTNQTTKIIVLAHTQESADDYIEEIREMMNTGNELVQKRFKGALGARYFTQHLPKKGVGKKDNMRSLSFYHKGWNSIQTFPPTTKARGKPGSIILMDELGFWCDYTSLQKDEFVIYSEVVRPITTDQPDTKVFGATTPNGSDGLAYELMPIDNHKTRYEMAWFPYTYRDEPEYLAEIDQVRQEYEDQGRSNSFRQEYNAELVSKTNSYFHKENEIDKVFNMNYESLYTYSGECTMAIDFGGSTKSRTVITISIQEDNLVKRISHKRYPLREDSTIQADILEYCRRFPNISKFNIDSQGGGSSFYAWFRQTFGTQMLHEVNFKAEKAEMYRLFKIACYQDRVKTYYAPELLKEFLGFTGDLKPSKHTTDDELDSFVMSVMDWLKLSEKTKVGVLLY